MKWKKFWLAPYPYHVLVAVGMTPAALERVVAHHWPLNDAEREIIKLQGAGRTSQLRSGNIVLQVRHLTGAPAHVACLVHEVFHATCFALERAGLKQMDGSDEAYAYVIEQLTRAILEWRRRGR